MKYTSITLFAAVIIFIGSIRVNGWRLEKRIGVFFMAIYLFFIVLTTVYEYSINPVPMCKDSKW